MFEDDIKLDKDGNSLIKNGDFVLTETDADFIYRMLVTTPGSWSFHEDLGIGLERFIGQQNNIKVRNDIKEAVKSFFKNFGFFPEMIVNLVDDYTVVCSMIFYILGDTETVPIYFSFSLENGTMKFYTEIEGGDNFEVDESQLEKDKTTNKYLKRREK